MNCSMPGSSVLHCLPDLLKFISIESGMLFHHLILCCPLLPSPSIFPNIRLFSNDVIQPLAQPQHHGIVEWGQAFDPGCGDSVALLPHVSGVSEGAQLANGTQYPETDRGTK